MQNQIAGNRRQVFSRVVSITIILNILSTLMIGAISHFAIGVRDPNFGYVDIQAFVMQKHIDLQFVRALTMFFTIGFIICLVLWLMKKRYSHFIISGLALSHFFVLIYCINVAWLPSLLYAFSILDLVMLVTIFLSQRFQDSSRTSVITNA